jgi:hypothetical protein
MDARNPPPPCPFAHAGLNSGAMASCPGYEAEVVSFGGLEVPGDYAGKSHPSGTSCVHLVSAVSRRGHRAACAHPEGLPLEWPAATELRGVPVRRPERVLRPSRPRS